MSDLPPPFSTPAYTSDHSTKVKLKIPGITQPSAVNQASTSTLALATMPVSTASPQSSAATPISVPALSVRSPPAQAGSSATFAGMMSPPTAPKATPPAANGMSATPPIAPATATYPPPISTATITTPPTAAGHVQPAYSGAYTQHYPAAAYRTPVASTSLPNTNSINPTRSYAQPPSVVPPALTQQRSQSQLPPAKSPTPLETSHPLRHVAVVTKPLGRKLEPDYRDGVRSWSTRLGRGETSVRISGIKFLDETDDHSDSEDKGRSEVERHEEEEEEEEEPPQGEKPVKRGRGRPKKKRTKAVTESPKGKGKAPAKAMPPPEEIQVKLNSVLISPSEDGVWDIELPVGLNIIEVGAKEGMTWRTYLDRIAAV
jgi:chromatin structure-remodeling complex subunit RSC4